MMKLENASMKTWRLAMAGAALALVSPLTLAAAAIQAITSTQQSGGEVVRIDLSEPLASLPAGFVVQTPPRIAIDLPGVLREMPGHPQRHRRLRLRGRRDRGQDGSQHRRHQCHRPP